MDAMDFFDLLFKAAMVLVPLAIAYLLFMIGQFFKEVTARTKQTEVTINEINKTINVANEVVLDVQSKLSKLDGLFETIGQAADAIDNFKTKIFSRMTRKGGRHHE